MCMTESIPIQGEANEQPVSEPRVEVEWTQNEVLKEIHGIRGQLDPTGASSNKDLEDLQELEEAARKTVDSAKLAKIVTTARRLLLGGDQRNDYH
jgi:hypothetical protein